MLHVAVLKILLNTWVFGDGAGKTGVQNMRPHRAFNIFVVPVVFSSLQALRIIFGDALPIGGETPRVLARVVGEAQLRAVIVEKLARRAAALRR
jgi:hypothetical protein